MPVTPGSRPLSPCFGGATHCGFYPKYPLKFHQNDHWMTFHPPWLPQPSPSLFTFCSCLGHVGCLLFTPGSLGSCFEREKTCTSFSQILRSINLLSLCHPSRPGVLCNPITNADPTTKDPDWKAAQYVV